MYPSALPACVLIGAILTGPGNLQARLANSHISLRLRNAQLQWGNCHRHLEESCFLPKKKKRKTPYLGATKQLKAGQEPVFFILSPADLCGDGAGRGPHDNHMRSVCQIYPVPLQGCNKSCLKSIASLDSRKNKMCQEISPLTPDEGYPRG